MLPPEAGIDRVMAPAMVLLLVALALITLVNVVGSVVIAGRAIAARPVRQPPRI
jgi:hypothetical protein